MITPTLPGSLFVAPRIFRICSGWYNTREEYIALLQATMSGPSTTAGTDLNQNKHLWIQGSVWHKVRMHNPTNAPIRVELFMLSLKCDDAGPTPGIFVEAAGLPFATGSATSGANDPSAAEWEFWDQSSRQLITASGAVTAANWTTDGIMDTNTAGAYTAPTAGQVWEGALTLQSMRWDKTNLSFIFPNIRRKCKIKRLCNIVIKPFSRRQIKFRHTHPAELRPRDYFTNACPNFSKHSYFLFMHARALGPVQARTRVLAGADENKYLDPVTELPAQVVITESRTYNVRRSGDSFPSFARAIPDSNAWVNSAQYGWLDSGTVLTATRTLTGHKNYGGDRPIQVAAGVEGVAASTTTENTN